MIIVLQKVSSLFFYALITRIFHWIAPIILKYRLLKGKEDKNRFIEKLGLYVDAVKRPAGFLVRIHGASVGETVSSLPIINALLEKHSDIMIMLTSNTLTSAQMMKKMLPSRCFHLYATLDTLPLYTFSASADRHRYIHMSSRVLYLKQWSTNRPSTAQSSA